MLTMIGILNTVLLVALALTLVNKYRKTRDPGFLWLAVPLVLLPVLGMVLGLPLAHWMKSGIDKLSAGQTVGLFPFTLVESGRVSIGTLIQMINGTKHLVWTVLVLVGVLMLYRGRPEQTDEQSQASMPEDKTQPMRAG